MKEILIAASIIVPLVIGATGLIKTQLSNYRILPVINVITGILLGILFAMSFTPEEIILYAWAGFVAGLAAGGLFDLSVSLFDQDDDQVDYGDGQSETERTHYHTDLKDEE